MYNYNTQLFECSSSQELFSDGEWQSSGYSSSAPVQKENQSKHLFQSSDGFPQERAGSDTAMVEEVGKDGEGCERDEVIDQKEGGCREGEEGVQERIAAHIQFCTSGMIIHACVCIINVKNNVTCNTCTMYHYTVCIVQLLRISFKKAQ